MTSLTYLLSIYPAVSHTFLLQEIRELRIRGFKIHTASVNQPNIHSTSWNDDERRETGRTLYLKEGGVVRLGLRSLGVVFKCPLVALRGFRAALRFGGLDLQRQGYALAYLAEGLLLGQWMRSNGSFHLHVHFGGPVASVAFLTAAAWDLSWSMTIHGPDEFYETTSTSLAAKLTSASFTIAISHFTRSQLLTMLPPSSWDKVEVVRLGVKLRSFETTEANIPGEVPRLLCVGRLVAVKAQSLLIDAVRRLSEQGYQLEIHLVGDGKERESLVRRTNELTLQDRVFFHGSLSHADTLKEVSNASIFVLASFAEGLPIALMEAMAAGIPVISTYIAGIPELIENGNTGTLVPAGDTQSLASAIRFVLDNPERSSTMVRSAQKKIAESFNIDRNVDQLAEVFLRRLSQ